LAGTPFRHVIADLRPEFDAFEWMLAVLQKKISFDDLKNQLGDMPELESILTRVYTGRLFDRNKAIAILAYRRGITIDKIVAF
jgi:hypothetical protein